MNRTTATHEAGHAIGRLLTATTTGVPLAESVTCIDVVDAVCFGPAMSDNIQTRLFDRYGTTLSGWDAVWKGVARVCSGEELAAMMFSRMLYVAMGPAAEARLGRLRDATPIYDAYPSMLDREDFRIACGTLGYNEVAGVALCAVFLGHAMMLLDRPAVWAAVEAVARELRTVKSEMPGLRIVELAWPHLSVEDELLRQPLPPSLYEMIQPVTSDYKLA